MRRRVAALIALSGLAAVPAVSDGAQPSHPASLKVSVKPSAGSARTGFAISFRASRSRETISPARHLYRITASNPAPHGHCQAGAVAQATRRKLGSLVRVVLAPKRASGWCAGTFRGQVWDVSSEPCPRGLACQAIMPLPRMIGKFSFRVTRR